MDHAITIGDVLIASSVVVGIVVVLGAALWVLAAYAKGMSQ